MSFTIILYLTRKIQAILENYRQRKIKVLADVNMCRSSSLKKIMYFQGKGDERRLSNKERWHTNALTGKLTEDKNIQRKNTLIPEGLKNCT